MIGIDPFQKVDLLDQLGSNPNAVLHLFRRHRLAPSRLPSLRQISEWAAVTAWSAWHGIEKSVRQRVKASQDAITADVERLRTQMAPKY